MGLTKSVGILTTVSKDSLTLTGIDEAESDKVYSGSNPYATNFTKVKEDYSSLLGQKVKVMFKDGKTNNVLGIYAISDNTSYTVAANGTEKDGDKVKVSVRFRGREVTHASLGQDLLHRFAELCSECSTVEKQPKLEGRQMLMFLAPAKDK